MADRDIILSAINQDTVLTARTYKYDVRSPIQVGAGRLRAEPGTIFKPQSSGFGKGRFFEQGGSKKFPVSNVRWEAPDGGLAPNDYLCAWAMHDADGIGVRFDRCTFFGLNVAYIGYAGRKQETCMTDCTVDQNHQPTGFDSFGILTRQTGLVAVHRTTFRNGGTRSNYEHQIYLSAATPLLVEHCKFETHLYGRYIQVYDGGQIVSAPSGWTIMDSTFGRYLGEWRGNDPNWTPPGYQIAVQTNPLIQSNLLRNNFFDQHYKSVWVQGNVHAEGNTFTGDGTAYMWVAHPKTVSSKADVFGSNVTKTEAMTPGDKFVVS